MLHLLYILSMVGLHMFYSMLIILMLVTNIFRIACSFKKLMCVIWFDDLILTLNT
jgi:hypothetical protein